jgi:hypothetical protein
MLLKEKNLDISRIQAKDNPVKIDVALSELTQAGVITSDTQTVISQAVKTLELFENNCISRLFFIYLVHNQEMTIQIRNEVM